MVIYIVAKNKKESIRKQHRFNKLSEMLAVDMDSIRVIFFQTDNLNSIKNSVSFFKL